MFYFNNDYSEGCHEKVLEALIRTNLEQTPGYGEDRYCAAAADKIRRLCGREDLSVHFLVGGTQANLTVIAAVLRPHQGALGAASAHINVHETGAVEATGHKVLWVPSDDGKVTAAQVTQAVDAHWADASFEHTVQPKLVYISNPTELGTLYTLAELEALSAACHEKGLYLFLDGARLGYGLAANGNDVTMADYFLQTGCPFVVVANKMDKLKRSEIQKNLATIRRDLELPEEVTLVPFSAEKGLGRDELVKIILDTVKNA